MKKFNNIKRLIISIIILISFSQLLNAQSYGGSYSVDGDISEWNLTQDFFSNMNQKGDNRKVIESYLYMHYDCANAVMYVLVLTKDAIPGLKEPDNAWIAINSIDNTLVNGNSGNNGTAPDFAWYDIGYLGNSNYVKGYEASFPLSVGHFTIKAHMNVYDDGKSQTSSTDKKIWPDLNIDCSSVPTYDVGVVKDVSNTTPLIGENFEFTITVTNNSDVEVQDVEVNDLINSSYFTYVGKSTTQGGYNQSTGLWNVGNLDIGQSETLTITVQAVLYDEKCGVATVTDYDFFNEDSNEPNNSDDACVDPCCDDLDLVVEKTVDDPTPDVNDIVKFTITVTNTSPTITATGIVIEDIISPSYVFQSYNSDFGTYNSSTGLWTIPSLFNLATASLDVFVKVLECGDNIALLVALDQTDSNSSNNEAMAVSCPDGSSGGGDGGIESDGSLANKIASRNYFRMRNNETTRLDNKSELVSFREIDVQNGLLIPTARFKSETSNLLDFIPEEGPFDTEAQIVTPNDLLGLSNAQEVFSADYYRENNRLGAILAMTTKSGEVYNHTKLICDRLTGANLDLVRIENIHDKKFILTKLIQQSGHVDFAISFIVYESNGEYIIDNRWHKGAYRTDEQADIFNFQVWSVTPEMTLKLVDEIITRLKSEKNVRFNNSENPKVPEVFVRNGYYKNGSLYLNIYNETGATELTVSGNLARVENGEREDFSITVPLNPGNEVHQLVEVSTGHSFDISFSVANNMFPEKDGLYFADGPWGTYTEPNAGIIEEFVTLPFSDQVNHEEYIIERDASIRGEVKSYVSLFRSLKVGNYPVDLSAYNQIEFQANGLGILEIIVTKEGIESWTNQFRKVIHLEPEVKTFTISYSDLTSVVPAERFTADDVVSVVFNSIGNGTSYQNFEINISDLKFKKGTTETGLTALNNISVENYPNPFFDQTMVDFNLPASGDVQIILYDILGQQIEVIADNYFNEGNNSVSFSANGLTNGTYIYKLFYDANVVMKRMSVLR